MSQAWRLVLNPSDLTSGYVLWRNGRIDTIGNAVTAFPAGENIIGQAGYPVWYTDTVNVDPAIALTISDWSAPGGYTSNYYGSPGAWGGATQPLLATAPNTAPYKEVVDAQMNPDGSGEGYYLKQDGTIVPVGNAPSIGSPTALAPYKIAKRLLIDWTNNAWYVMSAYGGIFPGNGAPTPSSPWPNIVADVFRDFWMDFSTGAGICLDMRGNLYAFGGAQQPFGGPHWTTGDIARGIGVVSDGTGGEPLTITILDLNGNLYTFQSSTAPVVGLVAPDGTTTSRPLLSWDYQQPQGNAQASWKVRVYELGYTQLSGFDPDGSISEATFAVSGSDATTRSVTPTVDIPNGTYMLYVQVTSTAGIASSWSSVQWTQNVTLPPWPTLAVQAGPGDGAITITASMASGTPAGFVLVNYADPDNNWVPVRGATALPVTSGGTVSVVDSEVPIGVPREYSAVFFETASGYVASEASPISQATASGSMYLLTVPTTGVGGPVYVTTSFVRTSSARGGTFLPAGAERAVWISDGAPTLMGGTLTVTGTTETQCALLETMFYGGLTLLLRDAQGLATYLAVTGNVVRTKIGRGADSYVYQYGVDVTEVDRPAP